LATTELADNTYSVSSTAGALTMVVLSDVGTISGLSQGVYNDITVTQSGCTSTADIDVTLSDPATPTLSLSSTSNPTNCSASDGSIILATTELADNTYSVSSTAGALTMVVLSDVGTISGLSQGVYNDITVTQSGCTSTADIDVTLSDPATPTLSLSSTSNPTNCSASDGSIILATTELADNTYSVSSTAGALTMVVLSDVGTISGLSQGVYNDITVTQSGCTSTADIDVTLSDPATPTLSLSSTSNPTNCSASDGSIILATTELADNTYSVSSTTGALTMVVLSDVGTISGLSQGVYNDITITQSGCTSTTDIDVTLSDPATPTLSLSNTSNPTTCSATDGSIVLATTELADNTYSVSSTAGPLTMVVESDVGTISGLSQGVYNDITITQSGCTSTTDIDVTLSDPATPTLSLSNTSNPTTCSATDGSIVLATTELADNTYSVSSTAGPLTMVVESDVGTISGLSQGVYNDITIIQSGCTSTTDIDVTLSDPATPTLSLSNTSNPNTCSATDGSIVLATTELADNTYSVSSTAGPLTMVVESDVGTISGLSQGVYNDITIIQSGCTSTTDIDVTLSDPATPTLSLSSTSNPTNCSASDGSIILATTELADNTYSVSSTAGALTMVVLSDVGTISGLSQGVYNDITVTQSGCTSTADIDVTLSDPATPTLSLSNTSNPNTCSATDGSIVLATTELADNTYSVSSTAGPLTMVVESDVGTISGLSQGVYNDITIIQSGCTSTTDIDVTLSDPATPTLSLSSTSNPTTCSATDGSIVLATTELADNTYSVSSTAGPLTMVVESDVGTISGLSQGVYNDITITQSGCTSTTDIDVTLSDPATPTLSLSNTSNPTTCSATDGSIVLATTELADNTYSVSSTAGPLTMVVESDVGTISGLSQGVYNDITITQSGCTSTTDIDVTLSDPATPTLSLSNTSNPTTCSATDGSIVLATTELADNTYSVSSTAGPLTMVVESDVGTISGLSQGVYNDITITQSGCTSTTDIDVTLSDPATPTLSLSNTSNPTTCSATDGSIVLATTELADNTYSVSSTAGPLTMVVESDVGTISGLSQGVYNDITIIQSGCTSTTDIDVTLSDPATPTLSLSNTSNPTTCEGDGSIELEFTNVVDGTYDIAYEDGDGNLQTIPGVSVSLGEATITPKAGVYNNLSITIAGCTSDEDPDVTLTDPDTPTIAVASSTNPSTCGGTDGSFEISGLDVSTAYDIDYLDDGTLVTVNLTSDVAGVILVSGLDQGTYSAITATRVGCTSNAIGPVVLSDPATAEIALGAVSQPTTCGGTDGSFEITGLDINTTYEISYTDDGTNVTANMTSNGEGSILVTDLNQGTYNNITATLSGCTSNAAGPVTLSDPGGECINEDFVTIWQVDDITTPFRLPKQGFLPEGKSYTIDWGDGTSDANTYTNVDVPTHSYSTAGAYEITYSGDFTQLRFEDRADLLGVANWGNTQWTSMNSMFKGCSKFNNIPSTAPDLTFTNDLSNMLQGASSFNQSMANWDVSSITDMSALFYEAASFQGDISGWRVSNVTNMRAMFFRASAFDGDLSQWDVSQVEEMSYMFYNASAFAGDISSWNVSHVTDMSFMFYGAVRFNGDLGNWNVANVTSMRAMFSSATNFPGGINNWNVSNVTDMRTMFSNAQSMSGSLDKWEVSSVTNMVAMFADALSFDGDIGSWDVASVVDMRNMFSGAEQFSSDISGWNVSAVSDMSHMFNGAIAFNADISDWNVFNVLDMTGMFNEASAFNRNLSGWCVGQINKEPTGFDAGTTAWTNPDWRPKWGVSCIPEGAFLSTWEVSEADLSVTVPVVPAVAYNYFVDWGDGYTSSRQTGNAVHTYSEAGTYTISIAGTFPRIYFNNRGDRNKIRFIDQWGDQRWSSMENAFAGCSKLQIAAVDAPNLKFVRNLRGMFKGATSLNSGLGHWDVSSATNMSDMFANTASFNGDVSEWNVGLVRDFSGMFRQATAFDQDLGNWDITNATKMDDMFEGVTLSTEHYDALLIGWAGLDAPPEGITFHGGSSTYCAGDDARKTLQLRHRWRITDGNRSTACILGIEGSLLSQVMLYPNPTQGIVHLQGWEEGKVRTVVIFDLSGRIVIKMDPSNQLNLEHLLEGTYILRLEGDQGLKTFKLIRN
jgi:surface protein